ncbi:hypothetical protein FPZ42_12805 [Mucilaginibacter achroorhodeus]|uniref:Uncharacterized protein n=1 Tax=Mucilaginibacter achroorhodeus TaxID=2599294 RepID=A0A563U1N6_9SPHI|nr:hypothetical protein [Mucilaginibacter achroorhodeus]TWR25473.1 hypothetical protein FPZ42_12805 [Mucilaginibacter achroorhodeus]
MKTAGNHNGHSHAMTDQIAKYLSKLILNAQARLAAGCSKQFNAYSVRKQKFLFIFFGLLAAVVLIAGLFAGTYPIPAIHQTYKPATHIGMASDINRPENVDIPLTDSSNKIIKPWKQH